MIFSPLLPILELAASLAYVGSKYLLSKNKREGWTIGIVGAVLTAAAFIGYARYVIVLQELGNMFLYGYGYLRWGRFSQGIGRFRIVVLSLIILLSLLIVAVSFTSSDLIQAGINTLYVVGTVLLIFGIRWGWFAYVAVHAGMAYISWDSGAYVFLVFQLVSAFIALSALIRRK